MIARRSLCPEKLVSNPGQGSKGINLSGWHGLDMSVIVTKRRKTPTNKQTMGNSSLSHINLSQKVLPIIFTDRYIGIFSE